jgi:hypothetical protein
MSNIRRIPFSEIFERLQDDLVRNKAQNVASEEKYKGAVNDVYLVEMPMFLPEDLIRKTANLATIADYSTGDITVTAAASAVTGVSTAWTSANSNDALLKADDEETVYRVAYSSATSLTLSSPSTWVDDAVSEGDYRLIFDRFALATDFAKMVEDDIEDPEVVYYYTGTGRAHLDPMDNGEYEKDFSFNYSTPAKYTVKWVDADPYLYIWPADDSTRQLFYSYIPQLLPLKEFTDGTVTITKDATAVTGASTLFGDFIDTTANDYYYRTDGDGTGQASEWYKVKSVTSDTALVLSTASLTAAAATSAYTISMVSKYPPKYDQALLYGAALKVDPNNRDAKRWAEIYGTLLPGWKAQWGKRIHGRKGARDLGGYMK